MDMQARARWMFAGFVLASAVALGTALTAQYAFGLDPCVLCQYQRIPYWAAAAAALVGVLVPDGDRAGIAWTIAALFACGGALAVYHFGVEQHWWHAATSCAAQAGMPMSFDAFRAGPLAPIVKPCDAVDWTVFGLSITLYNAAASLILALAAARAATLLRKSQP
jgi:disulfide bond formation protein DsbB